MSEHSNTFQEDSTESSKNKKVESNKENTKKVESNVKISILEELTKKFKENVPPNFNKEYHCFSYENETGELKPKRKITSK